MLYKFICDRDHAITCRTTVKIKLEPEVRGENVEVKKRGVRINGQGPNNMDYSLWLEPLGFESRRG